MHKAPLLEFELTRPVAGSIRGAVLPTKVTLILRSKNVGLFNSNVHVNVCLVSEDATKYYTSSHLQCEKDMFVFGEDIRFSINQDKHYDNTRQRYLLAIYMLTASGRIEIIGITKKSFEIRGKAPSSKKQIGSPVVICVSGKVSSVNKTVSPAADAKIVSNNNNINERNHHESSSVPLSSFADEIENFIGAIDQQLQSAPAKFDEHAIESHGNQEQQQVPLKLISLDLDFNACQNDVQATGELTQEYLDDQPPKMAPNLSEETEISTPPAAQQQVAAISNKINYDNEYDDNGDEFRNMKPWCTTGEPINNASQQEDPLLATVDFLFDSNVFVDDGHDANKANALEFCLGERKGNSLIGDDNDYEPCAKRQRMS